VNVAKIANTEFDTAAVSTGNGCDCWEFDNGQLTFNGTFFLNGTRVQETSVESAKLDMKEYYAIFVVNSCEGEYLPNYTSPDASAVLTKCKNPSLSRRFNLADTIKDAINEVNDVLGQDITTEDLNWPSGITNAFLYVESAGTALVIFNIAAIFFLVLAIIFAVIGLFSDGRVVSIALFVLSIVSSMILFNSNSNTNGSNTMFFD
jgi:hypothetical protein